MEYGADRERLLASSRASGILPTTFRIAGTTALGAYFTADGQAYCLSEAPNSDAVCKSHESKGLTLGKGDVHEVKNSIGV